MSQEIFLLASAAIANITFMDSATCGILFKYEAPRVLINACRTEVAQSLFARDQVRFVVKRFRIIDFYLIFSLTY